MEQPVDALLGLGYSLDMSALGGEAEVLGKNRASASDPNRTFAVFPSHGCQLHELSAGAFGQPLFVRLLNAP
ncbi:MAG: hypothetical protein ACR2GC_06120 [Methyloceanibacter sp.]|uniref:hypothetical protein n=1 Tax=Methyloceanibacter sp. TaxID=1965321 RepID=UPI003D9B2108